MGDDKPNRAGPGCVFSIALIVLVVLYVLSVGPAIWLRDHGFINQAIFLTFYAPIVWSMRKVPIAAQILETYAGLWATPPNPN